MQTSISGAQNRIADVSLGALPVMIPGVVCLIIVGGQSCCVVAFRSWTLASAVLALLLPDTEDCLLLPVYL